MTPDLLKAIDEALAEIETTAKLGRARITTGDAINGSSALQRCYERAKDARAELAERHGKASAA
jgi:hypothetical protein